MNIHKIIFQTIHWIFKLTGILFMLAVPYFFITAFIFKDKLYLHIWLSMIFFITGAFLLATTSKKKKRNSDVNLNDEE